MFALNKSNFILCRFGCTVPTQQNVAKPTIVAVICAGEKYFLSEDLARAAELQVVQQFAMCIGTKYGEEITGARFLEEIIREASGNSEFLRDFLLFWLP